MTVRKITLGIVIATILVTPSAATLFIQQEAAEAYIDNTSNLKGEKAPPAITGDNVYVVWWTNKTSGGDGEVIFRASTDAGATFGNKTNLSNTTDADSVDAEIAAEGGNVIVTWWERNQTTNAPVMRISNDNGETFGPTLALATNGTLGEAEEEPEEE
jgi:hypothetical protein